MSVLTTLALMTTALRAAVGREQQAYMKTRAALWPELDGSAAELAKAKDEVAELEAKLADARRERDDWQARAQAWRARSLERIEARPPQAAGPNFRPPDEHGLLGAQGQQLAQYSQQNAPLTQQQYAAMHQNLQNAHGQGLMLQNEHGLLGAQSLLSGLNEMWCNCVPSRAQVWAAHGDGA
jgi:hypothetical protein